MGNLVFLERPRWKLEAVISYTWIVIFSPFQRLFLCFGGCPIEWRHWRHQVPFGDMGNLVYLERRWRKPLFYTWVDIFSPSQWLFLCFGGFPVEWIQWRHQVPFADMGNHVYLERRRRKVDVVTQNGLPVETVVTIVALLSRTLMIISKLTPISLMCHVFINIYR